MAQKPDSTRVLLIDDDEMSRELLVVLLEVAGYAVTAAESGDAALDLLQSSPRPGLVLTDMQMPGIMPEQLAGRLRRACGRNTLLVAISGSRPAEATLAHFDGFLLKPFGAVDVTSLLEAHKSRPADASKETTTRAKKAAATRTAKKPSKSPRRTPQKNLAVLDTLTTSAADPASNTRMAAESHSSADAVTPPPTGAPPVLDEAIYRLLAGTMPVPQLREMYTMCLNDARVRIASMRSLAAAHDATQFMREAHAIKGSCGMLGATELHRIAAHLEKHGPDADGASVNSLDELSSACDRLERMLGARA